MGRGTAGRAKLLPWPPAIMRRVRVLRIPRECNVLTPPNDPVRNGSYYDPVERIMNDNEAQGGGGCRTSLINRMTRRRSVSDVQFK